MNDLIRLAIDRACESMGGRDGLFSAAGFSIEMVKLAGVSNQIDGLVVRAILTGRDDVEPQENGCHYIRIGRNK